MDTNQTAQGPARPTSLREARERLGLSKTALAAKVDVGESIVRAWEMGVRVPHKLRRPILARALRVDKGELDSLIAQAAANDNGEVA